MLKCVYESEWGYEDGYVFDSAQSASSPGLDGLAKISIGSIESHRLLKMYLYQSTLRQSGITFCLI